jgi:hypothetical protein
MWMQSMGFSFVFLDTTEYRILGEWENSRSDYLAETLYAASDIHGAVNTPSAMQALRVQRPFSTAFTSNTVPLRDVHAVARYHHGGLYLNSFLFWTDPI